MRKKRRKVAVASAVALLASLLGSVAALFQLRADRNKTDTVLLQADRRYQEVQIAALGQQLESLKNSSEELRRAVAGYEAHLNPGTQSSGLSIEDRRVLLQSQTEYRKLGKRIAVLEEALLQTPEKALALPLLRQQVADSDEKSKGNFDFIQAEVNRVYGMMEWFLGLMITLILGVAGLLVTTLRQNSEPNKVAIKESQIPEIS